MDEFADVMYVDDEDDFDEIEDLRNQSHRDHRTTTTVRSRRPRSRIRVVRPTILRHRPARDRKVRRPRPTNAGPVLRTDTGGLSYGTLIDAGTQVLAAIQPLPGAPVATGQVETDVGNMIMYQTALAEHAKRDEQIRTIGSLASKLLA